MNFKNVRIDRAILSIATTIGLISASSLAGDRSAIAQIDPNNMYTPDFMMSASEQRALELRLEAMRRNKAKAKGGNRSNTMSRANVPSNSKKQVITAKQYRYIINRMQQKMPGRDAEVRQMLDRMVEVRN
jgi:hypothetical protein